MKSDFAFRPRVGRACISALCAIAGGERNGRPAAPVDVPSSDNIALRLRRCQPSGRGEARFSTWFSSKGPMIVPWVGAVK